MGYAKNDYEKVKLSLVTGANANTLIEVAGMTSADKVLGVFNLTDTEAVSLAGLVVMNGGFKIAAATTAKKLLIHWVDVDAG